MSMADAGRRQNGQIAHFVCWSLPRTSPQAQETHSPQIGRTVQTASTASARWLLHWLHHVCHCGPPHLQVVEVILHRLAPSPPSWPADVHQDLVEGQSHGQGAAHWAVGCPPAHVVGASATEGALARLIIMQPTHVTDSQMHISKQQHCCQGQVDILR